jgi:hypothetical protein
MDRKFVPRLTLLCYLSLFGHHIPMIDSFAKFPDPTPFGGETKLNFWIPKYVHFNNLPYRTGTPPMHLFNSSSQDGA